MKTSVYFLLLVSFLFLFSTGKGQCPEWDLTFYSQQDLDNFGFPDCSHFPGNVIIKGYNITDLSNLSQLQSIGGNLEIENNSILTHLDAFPLLESIGGQLRINSNPQLESIATFENLKSIGLIFSLFGNESLAEISGFSELNHVGATLGIGGNPLLSDLEWLSALQTVGSVCGIYNNPALVNLSGLDNLESVGDYLDINNNNNLVSLQGLGSLQTTGGLNIYNNPALSSLGGLDNLTEINGFFSITNNASLTHLNELSPLTQINGPIYIQNHPLLSDISGLQNIEPAGISGLHILDNPNLETCNLESFCSYLSQGGYVEVSGNSGNCSSYSTFVAECTPCDPPINLGVDNLSTTTVSLIWESEGELFDVEWGTAGFVQGNGTLVTEISGNILDLYLLNPNSSYDFYVRQNCLDVNKESEWAGPFSFSTLSPCPTGSLIFNTQQQIDDFGAIYPHCTEALSITIQGNDITNLNGLSNITYIHQSLTINENPLLENLQGLENLHVVGTGLYIADNDQLVDVNGLTNLQSIGVSLDVRDNPMLENLDGFTNLYSIGSMGFSIMNNSQLTNIDGLSNVYIETSNRINISDNASLQSITGFNNLISTTQITIFFNPSLISINGLNGLQQAGSTIITHNQSLQSIEGFAGLQTTGSLVITNNPDLETMSAFGSLQSIESGYFGITHSKLENLDNFSSLYFSGGEVDFSHNTALENLNGLIGLQSIGGNLNIFINPALENLDGLVNVQSIGGYLLVSQNDVLSDISGLQNIDPATIGGAYGLRIYYNPNLYICNLENLCTYLQGSGIRYIAANAGTCFNEASLGNSCIPCETPQTLGAADVYATQATLLWEGAEALFEIEWGEAGFTHGNGTVISEISENEYILNGLNSATSYEFYVRRDCTLSHYSDWEGPYGFITMPCPTGNFTFTTQQEIDNFETIYGGCTDIVLNSLHIGPDFGNPGDITDLTPLQNIKSVNGNVTIQYNPLLTNLSGLENLTEIGGNLTIYNNLVLTSIDELSSLTEITGDLYIGYNESLTGIYGFNTLENVGNLTISFNNYLDIQGFQNLNQVNGNLILTSLTMANFLSFESLEQIDGELILQYSYINDLSGFNALISMGGLSFSYTTLAEVSGLNSLQSINGRIKIVGTNITNLDFLHNITTINGELNIGANHNLDDISGLQNIHHSSIQYLSFIENSNLYVCNLPNLCTYLSNPANPRNIYGNAGNCLDEATVTADCTPCAAPVDLGVENIQNNAAKLIWEADGDLFDIQWGEAGFAQSSGTMITDIEENQYELSGLQGGTAYEFYVRTNCGGYNQSEWTGPFSFTTPPTCPDGDLYLFSQADIDAFASIYPNCTNISGNIIINGTDITGLTGLSAIESIGGMLYIYNNPQLESLNELNNLTTVGNGVSVFQNHLLEHLDGLNSLTTIGGALDINSNNNLTDISALENIDPFTITHLYIRENPNLSVCNLPNFCTYLQGLEPRTISGNAGDCISEAAVTAACVPACDAPTALTATATSVSATLGWTSDGNNFDIEWGTQGFTPGSGTLVTDIATNSYNLTDLDYETQYEFYVRQDCSVNESDWAGPFGFTTLLQCPEVVLLLSQAEVDAFATNYPNCTQFWTLTISGSDITDLSPLSNITILYDELYINDNPVLTNLNGLDNLTSVVGLNIISNPSLIDISGLQNINPATIIPSYGMYITNNPQLSICNLPNFCEYLAGSGDRYIAGNGGDCNSPQAVLDACVTGNCPSYTRWNGMNWSNGEPDINKKVIIDGYFSANLEACKLEITPYGILNLPAEFTVTVNKSIINNGFVLVQSNANLIQIEDVSNIGAITVQRNSSPMMRLDYTLWSSPVDGQGIHAFSPQTVANRIYTYEGEEGYQVVGNLAANFEAGKGYMFRAPNDWNQTTDDNEGNPVAYPGEFIGVPFNGDISVDIHPMSYTSVGNPYPSNIRLGDDLLHTGNDTFLNANPEVSTLYFWTNTYDADGSGGYVGNNWATYTFMGGTSAGLGAGNQTPTAYVAPGQGFIIRSIGNGTQINFNNSMRVSNPALFFKGEEEERHRFWLNLKGINSENHNQILIGYTDGASYGIDHQIDGKMFGYEGPAIYNWIGEEAFVIQGRPLPFESSDVVPLGFKTETANKYVISLSQYEGLFAQGSVTIYLKDKLLGLTHNLMESDYEFESGAGEFEERFEVVYQEESTMGTSEFYTNSILIYTDQEYIVMDSQKEEILTVELYDLSGKNLFRNDKVNSKYYRLKSDHLGTQVLIVKVQTANGEETTKKLINQ